MHGKNRMIGYIPYPGGQIPYYKSDSDFFNC